VSKTAREGTVEIVKSVSAEEWQTMLVESLTAISEAAAAIAEASDDMLTTFNNLRERWSQIKFTS
jgi:hypothetical protein